MGMRFEVGCRCGWKQSLGLEGMALLGKPWDGACSGGLFPLTPGPQGYLHVFLLMDLHIAWQMGVVGGKMGR